MKKVTIFLSILFHGILSYAQSDCVSQIHRMEADMGAVLGYDVDEERIKSYISEVENLLQGECVKKDTYVIAKANELLMPHNQSINEDEKAVEWGEALVKQFGNLESTKEVEAYSFAVLNTFIAYHNIDEQESLKFLKRTLSIIEEQKFNNRTLYFTTSLNLLSAYVKSMGFSEFDLIENRLIYDKDVVASVEHLVLEAAESGAYFNLSIREEEKVESFICY